MTTSSGIKTLINSDTKNKTVAIKNFNSDSIKAIYQDYIQFNPEEAGQFKLLEEQIAKQSDTEIKRSTNFIGHVTAAAFIFDKKTQKVLLLKNKALKRLLQLGGHIKSAKESPFDAAVREMQDETGIKIHDVKHRQAVPGRDITPFDIDTHFIPANPKKPEPEHYHHDFRYLFINESDISVENEENQLNQYQWVEWEDFIKKDEFKKVARKIEELTFRKSASHFFDNVFSNQIGVKTKDTHCIAVQHILPSTYKFIIYLNNIFDGKITILAKPKSIDQYIKEKLVLMGIDIQIASRDSEKLREIVNRVGTVRKTVILDIGGYFSEIATEKGLPILGIVEDTENGHQKYTKFQDALEYPVLSVARSVLKNNEDALVGRSIVHATDSILRFENRLIEYMDCVIIGYGKIGAGIVSELQNKGIKPIVVEKSAVRAIDAIRNGAYLKSLDDAIAHAKVIFCATGNNALSTSEFRKVRSGAFIVSVTSSDDEFNLDYLDSEYEQKITNQYVTKYSSEHNYFYLMNNGNAVNFLFSAALDRYIYLVQAEIIVGIADLILKNNTKKQLSSVAGSRYEEAIANEWIKEFTN